MISFESIRDVHLEIATFCNAACPGCPRNFWGYPYNSGYPETYLSLENAKEIFSPSFLNQLTSIRINGNFGDIIMNPQGLDIVEYLSTRNPNLRIKISTNGGARDKIFWQGLAKAGAQVIFALDGLEDTHHLYRQNTVWKTVIKNAEIFIDHGGNAVWQMITFDHNVHQVDACRQLSKKIGFTEFLQRSNSRDVAPVFDRHGNLSHVLDGYQGEKEFKVLFHKKQTDHVMLKDIIENRTPSKKIQCETQKFGSIYIAANGDVSPCCWTGFYPRTYGHGQYHQAANAQLVPLIKKNNALEHSIEECIQWFSEIELAWRHSNYDQGRLVICDDNCGSNL